ncbi:MAG: succinylglutamate desuccinylase/aspartoacylase family protein, partial [Gammaproteobacteria bacterium]|nr:succinylglutamate desuccinylase/aspartoacylase family protein [Gammaproteobacteria bacterium]
PGPDIDRVVPHAGFEHKRLSDWFEGLAGTPADTDIYVQEGAEPGGTVLILGGTHANEPAGVIAAVVMLEQADVKRGRLMIAPYANPMARTHTFPQDAHPQTFSFRTPNGVTRAFRYGARITNPVNEWPNPDIYIHPESGQTMAGIERSNLNRAHPGVADGGATERLAYGFMELIKQEKVDLAIDLHEASPEYPVVDALVAHERAMELAAMVTMELEFEGVPIRLEPSPKNLRGLNHREWGDNADVLAVLLETCNASAGRFRGRTDEALILTGEDKAYEKAAGLGRLYVPWESFDKRFEERVARHVTTVRLLADNLEFVREGKGVTVEGLPAYQELSDLGVGAFLSD